MAINKSVPVRLVDGIREIEGINSPYWDARYQLLNRPGEIGGTIIAAHMTAYIDADSVGEIQVICLATGSEEVAQVLPGAATTVEFSPVTADTIDSLILFRGRVISGDGSLYITDAGATSGDGDAAVEPSPPVFTAQPPSVPDGEVGGSAAFVASVTGAVSLQWFRDDVAVPGETGTVIVISPLTLADAGAVFYLEATNAAGVTESNRATLTVTEGPVDPTLDWDVLLQTVNVTAP